nr:tetratricopeptide repeat protein [Ruficoccus amylovorans]
MLQRNRQWEAAEHCLQQVLAQVPGHHEAQLALADHFMIGGRADEARQLIEAALAARPGDPLLLMAFARACSSMGEIEDALAALDLAESKPGPWQARAGRLFALNLAYLPDVSAEDLRDCGTEWEKRYAPVASPRPVLPARRPGRWRIGYYSPDFCRHSVAHFLPGIFERHDRDAFEIHLYSDTPLRDEITARYRQLAEHWHELTDLPDAEAVATLRAGELDLLVDCSGFFGACRPQLFSQRPARVQAHFLGYNGTTGLRSLDYRFTDAICEPPGTEAASSEKLVRLEPGFHCYRPLTDAPEPGPLPSATNGYVTFGSFNNLPKVNDEVVALCVDVLQSLPDSRLLIKAISLTNPASRQLLVKRFEALGIDPGRIDALPPSPGQQEHLETYDRVDITLDTFPCNGTTTTLESLWMGVPVLTLPGQRHSARVSASLLSQVGLQACVVNDPTGFVETAKRLARDEQLRADWRNSLRQRIRNAPLGDPGQFVPRLEAAYRQIIRASES